MRLMSFSATIEQMRAGTKTVTRRLDAKGYWMRVLEPGSLICAVEKGQGLQKGESIRRIGVIEIVRVERQPLQDIRRYRLRGRSETIAEGFESMTAGEFERLFCRINRCDPDVDKRPP